MKIHCFGLNHTTSLLNVRECLAFTPHRLNAALARLGCGQDPDFSEILEIVILSTCNRVEIYAVANRPIFDLLATFLSEIQSVPVEVFKENTYRLLNAEAVEHLFRVSAGLESVVLGEPQILGQVTDAYSAARRHNTSGKILSRLFQAAIFTGKKVRTDTRISHNPASISSVAVNLIAGTVHELETSHVLIVGAGEMAEIAVESLRKRGVRNLTVLNRTLSKAKELAERWEAQALALESLRDVLAKSDVVITSTGAPHLIIKHDHIREAMAARPDRPMVVMDIAVPRDVEESAADIPNVQLFDLDTLASRLDESLALRAAEVPSVEAIIEEEVAAYLAYLSTLDVIPIIKEIRRQANAIREDELQKTLRQMPDLSNELEQHLDTLTRSIVTKILHQPTIRLREAAGSDSAVDYANVARGLFGIDQNKPTNGQAT